MLHIYVNRKIHIKPTYYTINGSDDLLTPKQKLILGAYVLWSKERKNPVYYTDDDEYNENDFKSFNEISSKVAKNGKYLFK